MVSFLFRHHGKPEDQHKQHHPLQLLDKIQLYLNALAVLSRL